MAKTRVPRETDSFARAIDYLGALEVAPGRYAYRDDNTQRYYICHADDLARLQDDYAIEALRCTAPGYDYSLWCADTAAVEMPAWWTPERRFACPCDRERTNIGADGTMCCDGCYEGQHPIDGPARCAYCATNYDPALRVTASLDTGEEILA